MGKWLCRAGRCKQGTCEVTEDTGFKMHVRVPVAVACAG
jgi:hypothetical protein